MTTSNFFNRTIALTGFLFVFFLSSVDSAENDNDFVIRHSKDDQPADSGLMCYFGNLTMNLGDELNEGTSYNSACMKCFCEVPPVPLCQRLPDEECDVTEYPPF